MKKLTKGFVLFGALGLSVACADGYNYVDSDRFEAIEQLTSGFEGNMEFVDNGQISGDIGAVRIDSNNAELNGADQGNASYIEVMGQGENGIAMNVLSIEGGIDHDALQPGFASNFNAQEYDSDLFVTAIGCSGDREYDWDYDQPADDVDIEVLPGDSDDSMRIDYTARTRPLDPMSGAPTGDVQTSSGSFTVLR